MSSSGLEQGLSVAHISSRLCAFLLPGLLVLWEEKARACSDNLMQPQLCGTGGRRRWYALEQRHVSFSVSCTKMKVRGCHRFTKPRIRHCLQGGSLCVRLRIFRLSSAWKTLRHCLNITDCLRGRIAFVYACTQQVDMKPDWSRSAELARSGTPTI